MPACPNVPALRFRSTAAGALLAVACAALTAQTPPPAAPAPPATAAPTVPGQGPGQAPQGGPKDAPPNPGVKQSDTVGREAMWPAPHAEDWQKPVLIQFQRTWADATALSKATRRPILVCVNMDGEPASEHYAGIRYRQPEVARLYEPYVCVIASVYRHTPRDFDEQGRRVPCPRFGSVTCGEHIAIEPMLYEKFMDGKRIAPRHIMVELDGSEKFDVYYAFDTFSVFAAITDGIQQRKDQPPPLVRGDKSLLEKVLSPDSADKNAVELAWQQGDGKQKRALLEAAAKGGEQAPVDLLRLGLSSFDKDLVDLARKTLAQTNDGQAVDLIGEALRLPNAPADQQALIAALDRLGASVPRARTLAAVHRGLDARSAAVDVDGWSKALASGSYAPAPDPAAAAERADRVATAAAGAPQSADAQLDLAEASLAQAFARARTRRPGQAIDRYEQLLYDDARRAAEHAVQLGATGWRPAAALAVAAFHLGDKKLAYERAIAGMGNLPADATSETAMAALAIFAEARQEAIVAAVRAKQDWPTQWLTDVHAAYSVLGRHPFGTDFHVACHYDFVQYLGGAGQATRILDEGLRRFPESPLLHERLRTRVLAERGADGLAAAYDRMLAAPEAPANLEWFAGYAAMVAAECHRRDKKPDAARAAYDKALQLYERQVQKNPGGKDSADHYAALALAGKARLAFEAKDDAGAVDLLLQAFARRPEATASPDGLNLSPADTARVLKARLESTQQGELLARLQAALQQLDPALLALPAYERELPAGNGPRGRRRGG